MTRYVLLILALVGLYVTGLLEHVSAMSGGTTMAVTALSTSYLTLLEIAKRLDPNGAVARIVELLEQTNEILLDMPWKEGNLITGERTTVRTGLPDVFWRMLNAGVPTSKSHTAQIDEACGMLEAYSQVDRELADLGGNAKAVRLSEARAFFEAMNQEFSSTLFYGTALAPEEFIGLAARYSSTSAGNGDNIIKAGGTGSTDNTSIYLIAWDQETICGIYPKGSSAGIKHEDLGVETVENAGGVTGNLMRAYRDHWQWKCGIALKDWRYVVRICNIDVSNLSSASDAADLLYYMADAEERLPNNLGRRAFYMNRTVRRFLRHQTREQVSAGGGITFENVDGRRQSMFGNTPVRTTDALLSTEDVVA
jgi:hypothetical protein